MQLRQMLGSMLYPDTVTFFLNWENSLKYTFIQQHYCRNIFHQIKLVELMLVLPGIK